MGTALEPYGLVYNPKRLQRLGVPPLQDWNDLLNPKLKGEIAQCAPTRSSSSNATYEVILSMYGEDKGWEWLRKLAANTGIFTARSRDVPTVVAKGEFAAGFAVPSYMAFEEKLARSTIPGRGALDAVNTLILAVPGTALGIAYIRAFHVELPGLDRGLTSFWIVMPLVLAVRRLPYTVRGSLSSIQLVHRSMEEAAASVGATGARIFRDITLPLVWRGILVGSLFSFMTSLQEASAVLFLALGGWEGITNGIFTFYIAGSASEAAALGVILIVLAAVSTVVINRIAGTRMGGVFG